MLYFHILIPVMGIIMDCGINVKFFNFDCKCGNTMRQVWQKKLQKCKGKQD